MAITPARAELAQTIRNIDCSTQLARITAKSLADRISAHPAAASLVIELLLEHIDDLANHINVAAEKVGCNFTQGATA